MSRVAKTDLIKEIAERTGLSRAEVEKTVNALIAVVEDHLANGDSVVITGFGRFYVTERAARKGRNPRTGETIEIPGHKLPLFKAGAILKKKVEGAG